jgi:hypothetical protein
MALQAAPAPLLVAKHGRVIPRAIRAQHGTVIPDIPDMKKHETVARLGRIVPTPLKAASGAIVPDVIEASHGAIAPTSTPIVFAQAGRLVGGGADTGVDRVHVLARPGELILPPDLAIAVQEQAVVAQRVSDAVVNAAPEVKRFLGYSGGGIVPNIQAPKLAHIPTFATGGFVQSDDTKMSTSKVQSPVVEESLPIELHLHAPPGSVIDLRSFLEADLEGLGGAIDLARRRRV